AVRRGAVDTPIAELVEHHGSAGRRRFRRLSGLRRRGGGLCFWFRGRLRFRLRGSGLRCGLGRRLRRFRLGGRLFRRGRIRLGERGRCYGPKPKSQHHAERKVTQGHRCPTLEIAPEKAPEAHVFLEYYATAKEIGNAATI